MTSFWSGFLGALAALFVLFTVRRVVGFYFWRRWHRGGHGPRHRLYWLFRRIGARPDQQRILRAELDAVFFDARSLRGEADALREELARLLGAPALDEAAVSAVLERPLAKVSELRAKVAGSIARVHAALDAGQRERLAALVARGPHGRRHRHGTA
jgi:Spy/CpxP family protein refolding chaperone